MLHSIDTMMGEIARILDGRVHSAWLYGSVVFNDFQLGWSDIDFLVLAEREITQAQADALLTLRQSLSAKYPGNPFFRCFEGVIAQAEEFRKEAFSRLVYWGTSGQRVTARYHMDAFSMFELARYGKRISGSAGREIFAEPSGDELAAAVRAHYDSIRKYAAQTDERLYSCGWLLDIARCIYTLRHNDIIAKTQAGRWALENQIFPDGGQLEKTLEIRKNPLKWKDDAAVKEWLKGLGPTVQAYADVLERELSGMPPSAVAGKRTF